MKADPAKHRSPRERASGRARSSSMAPPHAVPDEVQAALSGMMEQVSAISAAPTDAERERQYDVLAGMLATATAQGPASEYLAGGGSGAEEFCDDDEDARFAIHCAAPQSPRPEHREAEASAKAEAEAATAAAEARARWGDDSEESEDEPAPPPPPPVPPAVDAPGSEPAADAEALVEAEIALGMKIALGLGTAEATTQPQAPPAAELTDEEAAKAAWVAEAEAEWAAEVVRVRARVGVRVRVRVGVGVRIRVSRTAG